MSIEKLKQQREQLDQLLAVISSGYIALSRERSLAYTSGQDARMFIGKVMGAMGNPNPYPESMNPASQQIEPPSDKATERFDFPEEETETSLIKRLRKTLEELKEEFANLTFKGPAMLSVDANVYAVQVFVELTKTILWLGMCLGNIRDAANQDS